PACRGRPVLRFAKAPVLFEGISRFLRESAGSMLWKAVVGMNCRFSTIWRGFNFPFQLSRNAQRNLRENSPFTVRSASICSG
ncbi:hypothetical protein, partial [uncultured Mailhella sp.]|uniref:hypothetical protein n=1 Tax=uncultured Mailhella sp. TaxID=1981031 RepID=UPI0025D798D6